MKNLDNCDLCKSDKKSFYSLYKKEIKNQIPWNSFIDLDLSQTFIEGCICKKCGWIFKNPSYTEQELNRLYNFTSGNEISDEAILQAKLNSDKRSLLYKKYLYDKTHLNFEHILDVGGRNGEIMTAFLDDTNCKSISVLDMDAGLPIDKRISKIRVPFLEYNSYQKYDLITMFHILEHTDSPSTFLKHAHALLNENGYIFIEVPLELVTQIVLKHIGDHRHLGYFSRNTLKSFLKSNGFSCVSCEIVKGLVGGDLAVIRAIGKKSQINPMKFTKWNIFYTIYDLFNFSSIFIRLKNEIKLNLF